MRIALVLPLALVACVDAAPPPVVSDYNGRIVRVQYHGFPLGENFRESPVYAVAVQTCGLDGRNDASYQGVRPVGQYSGEHTFLCV